MTASHISGALVEITGKVHRAAPVYGLPVPTPMIGVGQATLHGSRTPFNRGGQQVNEGSSLTARRRRSAWPRRVQPPVGVRRPAFSVPTPQGCTGDSDERVVHSGT